MFICTRTLIPRPRTNTNETGQRKDGDKMLVLEPDLEQRLRRFYAPHNKRLYELIGRDLGWDAGGWVEEERREGVVSEER